MLWTPCFGRNQFVLLSAFALAVAGGGCSRGELAAAERGSNAASDTVPSNSGATDKGALSVDSRGLIGVSAAARQTAAPASIEEILKSSPLKNGKTDCATPVSGDAKPMDIGTQCPTDPPAKVP